MYDIINILKFYNSFIVCSLRDVHKYGYIHNDLKIDNFVLNKTEGKHFIN
jgi:tRNA A-37 threonylcarbamoyl transferase component Bud32